jgi:hypothetical protein
LCSFQTAWAQEALEANLELSIENRGDVAVGTRRAQPTLHEHRYEEAMIAASCKFLIPADVVPDLP